MGFLDNTGLARLWQHINALVGNKVDKVSGKSLIADSEIARLASINAEDYVTEEELAAKLEEGVLTVNGQKGNVSLTADDVGALPNTYEPPVTSVNGQTGDVTVSAPDEIAYLDVTLYPNDTDANMNYVIPSPITKENMISMVWQGWTKKSWPGTYNYCFHEQWGLYVFDIIAYGYDSGNMLPYIYNDSTDKGIKVRFYYKV